MTIIWTHQGDGVENTLQAFANAWAKGITHFETDIQATKDGYLVLSHDRSIKRLTGHKLNIQDLTLQELQSHRIYNHTEWTLLADLLASFPDAKISIDMKSSNTLSPLVTTLRNRSNNDNLVIGSFNSKRVRIFRTELPQIHTALTFAEILQLRTIGKLHSHSPKNLLAMIPAKYAGIKVISDQFLQNITELKIPWHVWTVNSAAEMKLLNQLGATGIITDDVDSALYVLRNN
jgi:glycerophosphoryl diester phosphodiesterase